MSMRAVIGARELPFRPVLGHLAQWVGKMLNSVDRWALEHFREKWVPVSLTQA